MEIQTAKRASSLVRNINKLESFVQGLDMNAPLYIQGRVDRTYIKNLHPEIMDDSSIPKEVSVSFYDRETIETIKNIVSVELGKLKEELSRL